MTDRRRFKGPVKTQAEILVAHLWQHGDWLPTHALQNCETPYGFIGSAGHVRARELARNDCAEKLQNKVERARGGAIALDPSFWQALGKALGLSLDDGTFLHEPEWLNTASRFARIVYKGGDTETFWKELPL